MKQLRYLVEAELDKTTLARQDNGSVLASYAKVSDHLVQLQELTDEISASIYGADVNRMYRISSPCHELETYLFSKVNNTSDNVSLYTVVLNDLRYKIVVVRNNWIDISLSEAVARTSV